MEVVNGRDLMQDALDNNYGIAGDDITVIVAKILKKRYSCFYENLHSSKVILSCLIIVISWWIMRNIFSL